MYTFEVGVSGASFEHHTDFSKMELSPTARVVIVTGLPGAGKSTVLGGLREAFPDIKIVEYGTAMLEVAAEEGITRDKLRTLPKEVQQMYSLRAAHQIAKAAGIVLVATHTVVKTPLEFIPGLPSNILEALKPCSIVSIDADATHIAARRATDQTRKRDGDSLEAIDEHLRQHESYLTTAAEYCGLAAHRIDNSGDVSSSVTALVRILRSLQEPLAG